MSTMLNENGLTFKEIEAEIFKMVCEWGQSFAKEFLEKYDEMLMHNRNKGMYRNKGLRQTTIKTVFGEVSYSRRIYEVCREDGLKDYVHLLDEQLRIPGVGLISQNLADQLVSKITEVSYRECAQSITESTGQSISAMGVWKTIQALGEQVCKEEQDLVKAHKAGKVHGEVVAPVLFQEADGVYIHLQREEQKSGEIKVGIAYDGWRKTGSNRYALDEKVVVAGFSNTEEFHAYREASIAEKYNVETIQVWLMNGDGADWIKKSDEIASVFQLDPFHKNKAIRNAISNSDAIEKVHRYLENKELDNMFVFLKKYSDSIGDDKEREKVERLITYFQNNRAGLLPYQEQSLALPKAPEGLEYRNMGTMENHIWSIIAKRMKHNHTAWSIKGGNHLAKILAKKCSGRLNEVTAKLKNPIFEKYATRQIERKILAAGQVPEKVGKGYRYPVAGHFIALDRAAGPTRQFCLRMIGY